MIKLRLTAVVAFMVGVLFTVAGVTKVLPAGAAGLGAALTFLGVLLGGLSFVPAHGTEANTAAAAAVEEPPLSLPERILGIFYQPMRVFQNLRLHPRWLAAVLIIGVCSAIYQVAAVERLTPERIATHLSDKLLESGFVPEDKAAELREQQLEGLHAPLARLSSAINQFVWNFVLVVVLAGLFLLGVVMFGERINFWQALAVAAYATLPITLLQKLLSLALLYVKAPDDIHPLRGQVSLVQDNLGLLFSPQTNPVLFTAASMISVLLFYWIWLMQTGLRNGGERVSASTAWSIAVAVYLIFCGFAIASAALFPTFVA